MKLKEKEHIKSIIWHCLELLYEDNMDKVKRKFGMLVE